MNVDMVIGAIVTSPLWVGALLLVVGLVVGVLRALFGGRK